MVKPWQKFFFYLFLNINSLTSNENKIHEKKIAFEDIYIKPLTIENTNFYLKISNDERIKYQSLSIKQEKIEKGNIFKNKLKESNTLLQIQGIFLDNKPIGYIGFFKDNTKPNILFIYYAVEPKYWNKGIGTMATKAFINKFMKIAKDQNFNIIKATIKIDNKGSQRVLEKNNFRVLLKKNGEKLIKLIDNQNIVYEYELNL